MYIFLKLIILFVCVVGASSSVSAMYSMGPENRTSGQSLGNQSFQHTPVLVNSHVHPLSHTFHQVSLDSVHPCVQLSPIKITLNVILQGKDANKDNKGSDVIEPDKKGKDSNNKIKKRDPIEEIKNNYEDLGLNGENQYTGLFN